MNIIIYQLKNKGATKDLAPLFFISSKNLLYSYRLSNHYFSYWFFSFTTLIFSVHYFTFLLYNLNFSFSYLNFLFCRLNFSLTLYKTLKLSSAVALTNFQISTNYWCRLRYLLVADCDIHNKSLRYCEQKYPLIGAQVLLFYNKISISNTKIS